MGVLGRGNCVRVRVRVRVHVRVRVRARARLCVCACARERSTLSFWLDSEWHSKICDLSSNMKIH